MLGGGLDARRISLAAYRNISSRTRAGFKLPPRGDAGGARPLLSYELDISMGDTLLSVKSRFAWYISSGTTMISIAPAKTQMVNIKITPLPNSFGRASITGMLSTPFL